MLKEYEVIIASDVNTRDGVGIEVRKDDETLIEVFRDDGNKKYTITLFKWDLPLDLVEESIAYFKKNIEQKFID
jgi:hypothetical protein